ncbi:MAG: hypothetical protein JJE51_07385 [Thermoanaerobaculia bacterium]|nr:hypothetical protein [Thermoanaerobaculia bacterium]
MDEIKSEAGDVAASMKAAGETLLVDLRARFIHVRAALFQRGVFDPVLVRFDSATAPKATTAEIAAQLETIATAV